MSAAAWAWLGLLAFVVALPLGFDLWAHATGHMTMSGQIHLWMQNQVTGPIVVGAAAAAGFGLMYHFLINK